jgi:phage terminase large subunit-like protein
METRFDEGKADRACEFFEKLLVHTKGGWAREPFILADFQREIIRSVFGTLMLDPDDQDWVRLYRMVWLEVGRKNGKSELMAGLALLLTGADDEESAEVYGVARDMDQASLVFRVAQRMVELSVLAKHFRVYPRYREIVYPKTGSRYRVVPGDALGNLGQDPSGILFDEIIAQPNRALWDALKTAFGARRQPLLVAATTAGDDPGSFSKAEHDFSARVAEDPKLDPRRYVFIRSVPKDADWTDEESWKLANPALGLFLRPQALRDDLQEARNNPQAERAFRQFRLNQWQDTPSTPWVSLDDWSKTAQMVVEDQLVGRQAFGGLVAGSVSDLTALCWTFPPATEDGPWQVIWRHFLPEDNLPGLVERTAGAAAQWVKQGRLRLTEGDQIDVAAHVEQILKDLKTFDVQQLAHDTHGVIGIVQQVMAEHPRVPIGIAPNTPGTALLDWERLILAGNYHHGADPVTTWEFGHVMVKESVAGVLRIDRKNSVENVSAIYAAEIALRRALLTGTSVSAYEDGGLVIV